MLEGRFTYYVVQFRTPDYRSGEWVTADCGSILFESLPYKAAQGLQGDQYRALLRPEDRVWQRTGAHGFETSEQAYDVLDAIIARRLPRDANREFRVAMQEVSKTTTPVDRPRSRFGGHRDVYPDGAVAWPGSY